MCMQVHTHSHTYTETQRERERKREREVKSILDKKLNYSILKAYQTTNYLRITRISKEIKCV